MDENYRMNPEYKKIWVEALRSGRYQQGQGYLKTYNGKFCCLGVLCNIMGYQWRYNNTGVYPVDDKGAWVCVMRGDYPQGFLGDMILDKVRLSDQEQINLADLNDSGSTFSEIADYIEKNL